MRAATTLADPCTGARRRDFLLGLRRGQLAGAHVPSWCSRHGVDAGCSQRAGPPGELTTCAYQTLAEGTGRDVTAALRLSLSGHLSLRKSRLESFCVLVVGVLLSRTVNLSHLACMFPTRA